MSEAILILCLMTIFPLILTAGIFLLSFHFIKKFEADLDENQNFDIY